MCYCTVFACCMIASKYTYLNISFKNLLQAQMKRKRRGWTSLTSRVPGHAPKNAPRDAAASLRGNPPSRKHRYQMCSRFLSRDCHFTLHFFIFADPIQQYLQVLHKYGKVYPVKSLRTKRIVKAEEEAVASRDRKRVQN